MYALAGILTVAVVNEMADFAKMLKPNPDGTGDAPALPGGPELDPASYGEPAPTPFGASSDFDRSSRNRPIRSRRAGSPITHSWSER